MPNNVDDVEKLKRRLSNYNKSDVVFNEPHFTQQLILREGNRKAVIQHILNPEQLVYSYSERGKRGDTIHCLHFTISNTRTMRIPVIFDPRGKKGLYILTYIMRYRSWQSMIRKP